MMNFLASYWPLLSILAIFLLMHRSGRGCGMHGRGHQHGKEHADHATHDHEPAAGSGGPNEKTLTKTRSGDVKSERLRHH